MKRIAYIFCFLFSLLQFPLKAQENSTGKFSYDKTIADKFDLRIPKYSEKLTPTPQWFQNLDMIFSDVSPNGDNFNKPYTQWEGYRFELKDTLVERTVRLAQLYGKVKVHEQKIVTIDGKLNGSQIEGVELISHGPISKTAFRQAHNKGFKAIPYLHFTDIHSDYADQDVFIFNHPEILLRDKNGRWVNLGMDGTIRMNRYLVCYNSPSFWKLSLQYVKKVMEMGADGIFIDNVGSREQECFAPEFTKRSIEFDPYVHNHLFPDSTQNYAFDRFLQTVRNLVKSYGSDKVVILNSGIGTRFQKNGDGCMKESFIYSWAWKGRNQKYSWSNNKELAKKNEWFTKEGHRITAMSYLDKSRKEVKSDAFWAFASARLLGMIWWANLENSNAEILYKAHTGKELQPLQEKDSIAYKIFENGVIVLNDTNEKRTVLIDMPKEIHHLKLLDLYDDRKPVVIEKGKLKITVPSNSARVYLSI